MGLKLLVLFCITSLLLIIPIAGATYDVVSGIASNSTEYTTSAFYGELHNLSLVTGTGTIFIKASWDARMNFTAPLYGRFMRDGASLGRFNLTQSVYAQVGSYELTLNETTGTHYYGFEVYSNKRGTIYSRNFSAVFLKNGTYEDTTSISALQANDSYFNGTVFPNSTNFRNDLISTKEPAISQGISPQFWMFNKTWQNITTTWISDFITASRTTISGSATISYDSGTGQISDVRTNYNNDTVAGNLASWNATYNSTYAIGGGAISFSNGTNNISIGSSKKMRQFTNGIITALYVNQTSNTATCTGNITVTSSGVYKTHINWSSVNNASLTGLSSSFTSGEWLLYNMTENTGCIDFTFVQVHTKTS